ncbi:MAG: hypothetical protein J6S21_03590, partial [Victivallales bacterium]|nr:hypothetical protein [Victivallales bacterium]
WKKGTTTAAFTALIVGAGIAITGIICQQTWASHIHPWLVASGNLETVNQALLAITRPFHPWVVWGNPAGALSAAKFPINSTEIGFICNTLCVLLYVIVSLLTCRKPFNMDRMLHRGKYAIDEGMKVVNEEADPASLSVPHRIARFILKNMIGIDKHYTRGDKMIAYFFFAYSFVFSFLMCFVAVVIWNLIPGCGWAKESWSVYFFVKSFLAAGIVGLICTVWLGICGTKDLLQLFKDLDKKETNVLDDGRVVGNVSVAEQASMEKAEED